MNKKLMIITDSASDFTLEQLNEYNVKLVPMALVCGEDSYHDDKTVANDVLWEYMKNGAVCKTSQPSPSAFLELFEQAKKDDAAVICIMISSALSGTLQSAMLAKSMMEYDNIHIIDSKTAAAGQRLLVLKACELRREGKLSVPEIVKELENFKKRIRLYACIDTLEYLVRGGRLSKAAGKIGSFLSIKPIFTLSEDGNIDIIQKARGTAKSIGMLCDILENKSFDSDYPIIPLYACDDTNCRKISGRFEGKEGFSCMTAPEEIGPTVGCHIGPGGYGFAYIEKNR